MSSETTREKEKEANTCIALGAGVGALGATAAAVAGAVCPICFIVAPGLIGLGAYKRRSIRKAAKNKVSGEIKHE